MSTIKEMAEAVKAVRNRKVDYRELRFSKANLKGHIENLQRNFEKEFEAAEKRPLDKNNGTSQCFNEKSLAAYTAWRALDDLYDDIEWWGHRG